MAISPKDIDFSQLSDGDRIVLAEQLWDSIGEERIAELCPLTPGQVEEVHRRCAAIDSGETACVPLDEAMRRLRSPK